jgi:hypothetical protein
MKMGTVFGSLKLSLVTPAGTLEKKNDQICLIRMSAGSENSLYVGECASDGSYEVRRDGQVVGYFTGCPSAFTLTKNRLPPYAAQDCEDCGIDGTCRSIPIAASNVVLSNLLATLVVLLLAYILTRAMLAIYNAKDGSNIPIKNIR